MNDRGQQVDIFAPPIARSTDPETSKQAAIAHSLGKRAERQRQVLYLVFDYPGCTSGELSREMLKRFPEMSVRTAVESPHKRLSDLMQKGLVHKGGQRVCLDTHYVCATYWITEPGRQELIRDGN